MAKKIKKVVVNRDLCIGVQSCILAAESVFELDAENKAVIKTKSGVTQEPTEKENLADAAIDDATLLIAAQSCPTKAIFLYDEDGAQVYP